MTCKQIWRPDVSYTATSLGSEEGGRGSLQAPSSSSTTTGEQELEVTKRRNKEHIPQRRTPTVMVLTTAKAPPRESQASYKTIEKKKDPTGTLLQLSRKAYERTTPTNTKNRNWLCGWMDHEDLDLSTTGPSAIDGERSRLHTPMEGSRSTQLYGNGSRVSSSRYISSRGGRGREEQCRRAFQHYNELGMYMEEYHRLHCYTTLSTAPSLREDERAFCEGEDVEQDGETVFHLEVKSLYRGDLHSRELVNRLGVRDNSSVQDWERQLLVQNPRPTPPSIVKRRRDRKDSVDIMVNSTLKRNDDSIQDNDESYQQPLPVDTQHDKDHTPTKDDPQRLGAVELPRITHSWQIAQLLQQVYQQHSRPNKSTSVISVKKYLRVNSKNQETLVEEEEGEEEGVGEGGREDVLDRNTATKNARSHTEGDKLDRDTKLRGEGGTGARDEGGNCHSNPVPIRIGGTGAGLWGEKEGTGNCHSNPVPLSALTQEHLRDHLTLTKEKKEKLITNTAHALGVVSRDWAKNSSTRKNTVASGRHERTSGEAEGGINGHREQVKANSRTDSGTGYRNHITTPAPASREQFKSSPSNNNSSSSSSNNTSRPRTVHRNRTSGDDLKIEKLKSIYNTAAGRHPKNQFSSSKTAYPSRQPSQCGSRQASYLVTTRVPGQHKEGGREETRGRQYCQSRPVTRLGLVGSQPITRMNSRQYHGQRLCRDCSNLESLEESSYWNELPLRAQGRGRSAAGHMQETLCAAFGVTDGTGRVNGTDNYSSNNNSRKVKPAAQGGVACDRVPGTAYSVYAAVDSSKFSHDAMSPQSNRPVDPSSLHKALKGMRSAGWNEDLSLIVLNKKQEGGGEGGGGGGRGGGTDKIAQAIALAMNFCKPRESLMKKLTVDVGRKGRGRRENKYAHQD